MRRTTTTLAVTAALGAALTFGTANAHQAATDADPGTPVVNKNGHEVDAHAAAGQARAAQARVQHTADDGDETEAPATEAPETDAPVTETPDTEAPDTEAPATHDPNEHAGTHPDTHALPGGTDHGQDGAEHGHHAGGPHQGHGPDEHAGDHPNAHASGAPTEG